MFILRVSFFLFVFLSSVVFLQPLFSGTNQQTELQDPIEGQSAGDIFIESARVFFREEFEEEGEKKYKNMKEEEAFQQRMGSDWENKIQETTEYWTNADAIAFLEYLFNRIGQRMTLSRIKGTSYFKDMSYSHFLDRVEFYEGYIGEDGVTYRLNRSLSGFHRGDIIEIQRVIEFLEEYLGSREILQKMMMKNLNIFSPLSSKEGAQANLENVKDVIAYLMSINITEEQIKSMITSNFEGFVKATRRKLETKRQLLIQEETVGISFTLKEIDKMIVESIQDFLQADLSKVKSMITYLKEIIKDEQLIKDMAIRNLQGLAKSDPETLQDKRESLTRAETIGIAFILEEIDKMIVESIQDFLRADLSKVKSMITYLKEIIKDEQLIKAMAVRNLQGLARGDPETLQNKRASLTRAETIGIAFTLEEIDKMIVESIEGFLQADLSKVKSMITYLKEIIKDEQLIKAMAVRNLKGLAKSDPETLQDRRASLTRAETIGIAFTLEEIDKMIVESIQAFLQVDLSKVKIMITYLKEIIKDEQLIKDMAVRNLKGLASSDPETLQERRESLKQIETIGIAFTLEEIDKMIVENIQGFLQADLSKVKSMITYLKEIIKDEQLIKAMAVRNLKGLAESDPETLQERRASLTRAETIGIAFTLEEIDKMIVESIEGFLQADLSKVKIMITYLKEIIKDEQLIKAMAVRNLQGLAKSDPKTLQERRESLTRAETIGIAFTLEEIDKMIVESIQAFLQADLSKVKSMITYLKEIIKDEQLIKAMAVRNLKGLAKSDPKTLQERRESLTRVETIGIAFTLEEIDKMIVESIQAFLQADLSKVKSMITYLKEIIKDEQLIKAMAVRNLKGLAKSDPETLQERRESLTRAETIGIAFTLEEIDKMIVESIQGLLQADLSKVKRMITYLKEIIKDEQVIKDMAVRNLLGLAKSDPETLQKRRESLTRAETIGIAFTLEEIDKMIVENIQGFLRADLSKIKSMITYLKEIIKDEQLIKDMAIGNLKGLAKSDPETLQDKRESLTRAETIGIAFTLEEIDKMIVESIQAFLQADLSKVKSMITYLKEIIKDEQEIKGMLVRNLLGFSTIKSYELKDMIDVLKKEPQLSRVNEETLMIKIREMMVNQNLVDFYYNFDTNLKTLICTQALS